jgi:hypothetical protein
MHRVPSDVVKGVFHFLGNVEFEADIPKIHSVFFLMNKEVAGIQKLMDQFIFDESKPFPYSKTISIALDRLQKSNLLHCLNPRLDRFQISERLASEKLIEELFDVEEIKALESGADYFKSNFKIATA